MKILSGSQSILQNIQKGYKEKKQEILLSNPKKEPLSNEKIIQGQYFQYIPVVIQQYILRHKWKYCYKIQQGFSVVGISSVQLTVYIYTDNVDDISIDILTTFSFLLECVNSPKTLKTEYELYYYATPFLKQFPEKKGELIDEIHVNSGFTVKSAPVPIYIFRKEESQRVCIHEILHALGFDGIHPTTGKAPAEGQACLDLLEPIQGQHLCNGNDGVRIYEALTETQATILNVLWKNSNSPFSMNQIQQTLQQEKIHVQRKIQEIQDHYGISSSEKYSEYKQGVSKTISYFLFRGFLMNEINRFIQKSLLSPQSTDYVKIIQEGIKKQGNRTYNIINTTNTNKKIKSRKKIQIQKRKTLKMNYLS